MTNNFAPILGQTQDNRVFRTYPLLTGGTDAEMDSISIMVECLNPLTKDQQVRVLRYLSARYWNPPQATRESNG